MRIKLCGGVNILVFFTRRVKLVHFSIIWKLNSIITLLVPASKCVQSSIYKLTTLVKLSMKMVNFQLKIKQIVKGLLVWRIIVIVWIHVKNWFFISIRVHKHLGFAQSLFISWMNFWVYNYEPKTINNMHTKYKLFHAFLANYIYQEVSHVQMVLCVQLIKVHRSIYFLPSDDLYVAVTGYIYMT